MGLKQALLAAFQRAPRKELTDAPAFFSVVRNYTGALDQVQVDSVNGILDAGARWGVSWVAYALATAWGECKLRPVKEKGVGDKNHDGEDDWFEKYDTGPIAIRLGNTPEHDGDGERYCGRGFPQITGARNYRLAGLYLGIDLLRQPERALEPAVSAAILAWGMEGGEFTGRGLKDYLPTTGTGNYSAFLNARRIINGTDRASLFATHAIAFQKALIAGGWQ